MFSIFINKLKQASESVVKTTFSIRIIFCILSLAFITLSCGSGAYEPEQNTSQDDLTNETTGSIYPHAAGFAEPDSHGQYTLAHNIQSCEACHGNDYQGGTSLVSCLECHPPYPHRQGWNEPDQHGVDALAQEGGIANCAITCHGEDFLGKGDATSCYDCHELFPHDTDWGTIENHGVYVVEENAIANCQTACHGTDLSGGLSKKPCTECHASYPHVQDWEVPENHGLNSIVNGQATCQGCHGSDFLGGLSNISCRDCHDAYPHGEDWEEIGSNVSCYTCHSLYPHALNWESPQSHGLYLIQPETDKAECQGCHGTDFLGGNSGTSCIFCHDPYPHPTGWAVWDNHGNYAMSNGNNTCATACHGVDFSGGDTGVKCIDCHRPYPHNADWTTVDNPSNHGKFYVESYVIPPVISNDECASNCHGTDFSGGGSTVSCDSCHDEGVFPHFDQGQILWNPTGHQLPVNPPGSDAVCRECHSDYLKGPDGGSVTAACTTYCHL